MQKTSLILTLLSFFYLCNCQQNKEKTEATIQLSEAEFLFYLVSEARDSAFMSAYNFAQANYNPEKGNFVNALTDRIIEQNPETQLTSYFGIVEFRDRINFSTSNQEVIAVLIDEVKKAKEKTIQVLQKRIESAFMNASFLSKITNKLVINVKEIPERNAYSFTINRKLDKNRLSELLKANAEFGFWETYRIADVWESINAANIKLKELPVFVVNDSTTPENKGAENEISQMNTDPSERIKFEKQNPLFSILQPSVDQYGKLQETAQIGVASINDTAGINQYLAFPEIKSLFPRDLKFLWTVKPVDPNNEFLGLIAIKITTRDGRPPIGGDYIVEAKAEESNYYNVVSINMNTEGTRRWARMTKENIGRQIAIVINNVVYSFPIVQSAIEGGRSQISGNFTIEEAADLASLLNAGNMPKILVKVIDIKE